jgi:hypothetical protein
MRQMLQTVLMLLVLGCGSAHALDAAKIAAINKAADAFAARAGNSAKSGLPPRQSDPAVKALLDVAFDTSEIQAGPAQPMSALSNLNAWTIAVLKIGLVYTLAGSGLTDITALANRPDLIAKVNGNAVTFAPEMGRYFDAQVRLQGAVMDSVTAYLATATKAELDRPNVRNGLADIRAGNTRTIVGVITTLPIDGISDSWRRERMSTLNEIAPKVVKFLPPENLTLLSQTVTDVAAQMTDPGVKTGLMSFAATLAKR